MLMFTHFVCRVADHRQRVGRQIVEQVVEIASVKAAARKMLRARKGRIVLISSVVGLLGSAGQSNCCSAERQAARSAVAATRAAAGSSLSVSNST